VGDSETWRCMLVTSGTHTLSQTLCPTSLGTLPPPPYTHTSCPPEPHCAHPDGHHTRVSFWLLWHSEMVRCAPVKIHKQTGAEHSPPKQPPPPPPAPTRAHLGCVLVEFGKQVVKQWPEPPHKHPPTPPPPPTHTPNPPPPSRSPLRAHLSRTAPIMGVTLVYRSCWY
jgi:hypothetical protein